MESDDLDLYNTVILQPIEESFTINSVDFNPMNEGEIATYIITFEYEDNTYITNDILVVKFPYVYPKYLLPLETESVLCELSGEWITCSHGVDREIRLSNLPSSNETE
mmetsp:Transcript_22879/g.11046  ORF Transcript_22879/g.11046 Transcript_22879/m.11046 type:complete len:108 (-) Transcript_22879:1005-1328(-)